MRDVAHGTTHKHPHQSGTSGCIIQSPSLSLMMGGRGKVLRKKRKGLESRLIKKPSIFLLNDPIYQSFIFVLSQQILGSSGKMHECVRIETPVSPIQQLDWMVKLIVNMETENKQVNQRLRSAHVAILTSPGMFPRGPHRCDHIALTPIFATLCKLFKEHPPLLLRRLFTLASTN